MPPGDNPIAVNKYYYVIIIIINGNFLDRFRKIPKYRISWKSFKWEPICSIRTDGQMERQTWRR